MCKYEYEQISERTGKRMIFCKLKGLDAELFQTCISQRFCGKEDRYVAVDQKKNCKYYE